MKRILTTLFFGVMACFTMSYAQSLTDNFGDGNFTANPAWGGNTSDFVVNASNQLQLSLTVPSAGTRYLSVPAQTSLADSTTWEFWAFENFSPSSTNYGRVYLAASQSDLTSTTLTGYYIQLGGISGTTDSIELFRQDGSTRTKLLGGTAGGAGGTTVTTRIRVTRSTAGEWRVFADYSGGSTFLAQGSAVTDNTYNLLGFFGVYCVFTSTRASHFYFDDISISPLFVDAVPPTFDSAYAVSATQVDLLFNEPLQTASANTASNYALNNGISVSAAALDGTNPALVHLTVSTMTSGSTYQVTATGVRDLAGNAMAAPRSRSFTYFNVQPAAYQDIIINEIFADPSPQVGLPNAEFVELYNRSTKYINLQNYILNEGSNRTLGAYILAPNSYVIICPAANTADFAPFGQTLVAAISLTNAGEPISLRDASGNLIDSVRYSDSWYRDAVKKDGGWTLELVNPTLLCKGGANWIASTNAAGGTPGAQNSVFSNTPDSQAPSLLLGNYTTSTQLQLIFDDALDPAAAANPANYSVNNGISVSAAQFLAPDTVRLTVSPLVNQTTYVVTALSGLTDCVGNPMGTQRTDTFTYYDVLPAAPLDLIFNELMIDPDPVATILPNAEYIELYNRSNKAISLAGYTLQHRSFSSGTITTTTLGNYIILPNDYVLLYSSSSAGFEPYPKRLAASGFPSLNNTSAYLILTDAGGQQIDSILYSDVWYQDAFKKNGGYSLELINPDQTCKGGANWRASNSLDGGTPTAINSIYDNTPDQTAPTVTQVRQISGMQILLTFDEILDIPSASLASNYSISGGLSITSAVRNNANTVVLNVSSALSDQTVYTITFSGVSDCVGNAMGNTSVQFTYYATQPAAHYDILINEIFPDPTPRVGLPEKEFVEFYNRSNKFINLEGFTFNDGSSTVAVLPFYILPPNAYLVVASADDTTGFGQFGNFILVQNFPDLNVSSDNLVLRNAFGDVVDAVSYESAWFGNSAKAEGGWTLERINYNRPCDGASNWTASLNPLGGSPAQPNSVLQTSPDQTAPQAIRAFPFAVDSVRVYFDEALGDQTALNPANYTLDNGLTIAGLYLEPPFYNSLIVKTSTPLQMGTIYTLSMLSGGTDCVGNPFGTSYSSVRFALPQPTQRGDLVLNEILFNPVTGGSDFAEVYNKGQKVLNAKDLIFASLDGAGNIYRTEQIETDFLIFPGDYLAVTPDPIQVKQQYATPNPFGFVKNDLPTYDDSEGTVLIYTTVSGFADTIDMFAYLDDYHSPLLDSKEGVSLERINPEVLTQNPANWHSAATQVGYATPAYKNSSYATDSISGDDLVQLPRTRLSPDGDGFEDFILILYNVDAIGYVGRFSIYDAQGHLVRSLVNGELLGQEGQLQWDGSTDSGEKARVGIYVLVLELVHPDGTTRKSKKTLVVAGKI